MIVDISSSDLDPIAHAWDFSQFENISYISEVFKTY